MTMIVDLCFYSQPFDYFCLMKPRPEVCACSLKDYLLSIHRVRGPLLFLALVFVDWMITMVTFSPDLQLVGLLWLPRKVLNNCKRSYSVIEITVTGYSFD